MPAPAPGNNSAEYWDVNGISLNQFCWSIGSLTGGGQGSRHGMPGLRGLNIQFAFRQGSSFRRKYLNSRVITLVMWVAGIDPATAQPDQYDQVLRWNDNWQALKHLLWHPTTETAITRRWWVTDPATGIPAIQAVTGRAQIAGTMDPNMTGRTRADFQVDLVMSDPYFYGAPITYILPRNTPVVVHNPGDDIVAQHNFSINLTGSLVNPSVINISTNPTCAFNINTTVGSTDSLLVDPAAFQVTRVSDQANMIGTVTHSGDRNWMILNTGDNIIELSANGTGYGTLTFQAPYI